VENVSLQMVPGEVVGLYGPSGRGKTTLAKVLAGMASPEKGTVTVDGAPLPKRGFSPVQLIYQHPELAVNPRWRVGQILEEAYSPPSATLEALQLEPHWVDRYPHELSGGELQRICVARALAPNTRYLIADEMTAMLDAITQAQIWYALLEHVKQHNMGLLVIAHDAPLLDRLCTRVIEM